MRILVVRTDHLGDALLTTPLIRALAKAGNEVEFALPDAFLDYFTNNPFLRAAHGLGALCGTPPRWGRLAAWLRRRRFDALVFPHRVPKGLLAASLLSGTRRRITVHSLVWGRLTLHTCLRLRLLDGNRPMPEALLEIADALGAPRDGIATDLIVPEDDRAWAREALAARWGGSPALVVGLHPGTGWSACNFRPCGYAAILERLLRETDWNFVVTGIASEKELLERWPPSVLGSPRVWNAMGELRLRPLAAVIGAMRLYLCPPTGPLHVAGALRVPTLSPFCPLPHLCPRVWGPQSGQARFLVPDIACCRGFSMRKRNFCDFQGKLDPMRMASEAVRIVSATETALANPARPNETGEAPSS